MEPQLRPHRHRRRSRTGSLKFIMHGTKMKGKWPSSAWAASSAERHQAQLAPHQRTRRLRERAESGLPPVTEAEPNSVVTGCPSNRSLPAKITSGISKHTATDKPWQRIDEQPQQHIARSPTPFKPQQNQTHRPARRNTKESLPLNSSPPAQQSETPPVLHMAPRIKTRRPSHSVCKEGPCVQLSPAPASTGRTACEDHRRPGSTPHARKPSSTAKSSSSTKEATSASPDSYTVLSGRRQKAAHYFIFDLLHLNGRNLRTLPLLERKTILASPASSTWRIHPLLASTSTQRR